MNDGSTGCIVDRNSRLRRTMQHVAPCLVASTLFTFLASLYAFGFVTAYFAVIRVFGVHAWAFPFLDTDTVLSALRCVRKGVDVYIGNPCDVLARVYDYSPLWLALARVPNAGEWLNQIGLAVDLAFLSSLLLLPKARDGHGTALMALAAMSSAAVYAAERGNNDLVIFVLAATAAAMMGQSRNLRLVAYGAALLAGLLKYYPMPLVMLAARERLPRFFAITAVVIGLLVLFLATEGHDLLRALKSIPVGPYINDSFGSTTLTGGLAQLFHWPEVLRLDSYLAMTLAAIGASIALGTRQSLQQDLDRLTERERAFLFVGAVLTASFFFTAQNIGYRAVHLLLVLPSLIALWTIERRAIYRWTVLAAFGLLWAEGVRHGVILLTDPLGPAAAGSVRLIIWLLREAAWWWLVTCLLSLALALLLRFEMGGVVLGLGRVEWSLSGLRAIRLMSNSRR